MNNTTAQFDSKLDNAVFISYVIWRLCGLTCVLFGIPGHIFHIFITTNKSNRKEPTSFYFTAISICEWIYLIGVLWRWSVGMSIIRIDPRQIFSCGIFYSILIGPTILSNLYLASLSFDRSFMILYPNRYRNHITRRHVLVRILFILFVVILVMIPHHFFYYYDEKTTKFICEFHKLVDHWKIRLWFFAHAILFVAIPYIITLIGVVILLRNRRQHRQLCRTVLSESARRMERNALFILLIVIVNFFAVLPYVILEIFLVRDRLVYNEALPLQREKIYKLLMNSFLTFSVINYTFKFYVRLIISKSFRNDFKQLFTCSTQQQSSNSTHRRDTVSNLPI